MSSSKHSKEQKMQQIPSAALMQSVTSNRKLAAIRTTETKDEHRGNSKQERSVATTAENAIGGRNAPQKCAVP